MSNRNSLALWPFCQTFLTACPMSHDENRKIECGRWVIFDPNIAESSNFHGLFSHYDCQTILHVLRHSQILWPHKKFRQECEMWSSCTIMKWLQFQNTQKENNFIIFFSFNTIRNTSSNGVFKECEYWNMSRRQVMQSNGLKKFTRTS